MTPIDIFWLLVLLVVYFIPTLYAKKVGHRNSDAILLLNLFLGWTFIGWVIAMVWAAMDQRKSQ